MSLTAEQFASLQLIRTPHIGPRTFKALLGRFGSAAFAVKNFSDAGDLLRRKVSLVSEREVASEIKKTEENGAQFIFWDDPLYPLTYKDQDDFSPVLVVKGRLDLFKKPGISIVGARNASFHGCKIAERLATDLGKGGYAVISGLARGIDVAAHKGSLSTGTIAVLGTGMGHVYPEAHKDIFYKISEDGLIVTQFSYDTGPQTQNFPQRNYLIAGLAKAVLVVEAAFQSGSLLTAEYALELGRDIFAVPGSPLDPRSRGTNKLIKDGATLTETAQDVFDFLGLFKPFSVIENTPCSLEAPSAVDFSNKESALIKLLSTNPTSIDRLAEKLDISMPNLLSILTKLEIDEKVMCSNGCVVALSL